MLRPQNMFKRPQITNTILPNDHDQNLKQINKVIKETSLPLKEDIEPKKVELTKVYEEITSFINDSKNAFTEQKKEIVDVLSNYLEKLDNKQLMNEQTHKIEKQEHDYKMENRYLLSENEKIDQTIKKPKQQKRSYTKVTGDVLNKVRLMFPSLDEKYIDKIYVSGEEIFYKSSNKYSLLDTQLYCKLSKPI
jgi:hypothetical protein